jgi:NADP-dependent 3-hydroxy acid dehydrogenase YdfG
MHLSDRGYQVVAAARSTNKLVELGKEAGVHPMTLDVTDGVAVHAVVPRVEDEISR